METYTLQNLNSQETKNELFSLRLNKEVQTMLEAHENQSSIVFMDTDNVVISINNQEFYFKATKMPETEVFSLMNDNSCEYHGKMKNRLKILVDSGKKTQTVNLNNQNDTTLTSVTVLDLNELPKIHEKPSNAITMNTRSNKTIASRSNPVSSKNKTFETIKKRKTNTICRNLNWAVIRNISVNISFKHIQRFLDGINIKHVFGIFEEKKQLDDESSYSAFIEFNQESGVDVALTRNGEYIDVQIRDMNEEVALNVEALGSDNYVEVVFAKGFGYIINDSITTMDEAIALNQTYIQDDFILFPRQSFFPTSFIHPNLILSSNNMNQTYASIINESKIPALQYDPTSFYNQILSQNTIEDISLGCNDTGFCGYYGRLNSYCENEMELRKCERFMIEIALNEDSTSIHATNYIQERLQRIIMYYKIILHQKNH